MINMINISQVLRAFWKRSINMINISPVLNESFLLEGRRGVGRGGGGVPISSQMTNMINISPVLAT